MIQFTVNTKPRGKERPRHSRYVTYSTNEMVLYENEIKIAARQAMIKARKKKTKAALEVRIVVFFKPAKSWPSWKKELFDIGLLAHTSTPDTDNVCKAIFDAMNDTVYFDDKQIIQHTVIKEWGSDNRVYVRVNETSYVPSSIKTKRELLEWQKN